MTSLIICEIKKLIGSKAIYILPVGIIVLILVDVFIMLSDKGCDLSNLFRTNEMMINFLLGTSMFAVITSYLFSIEYEKKTIQVLFTYPITRSRFIAAKLLTIFLFICLTLALLFMATLSFGLVLQDQLLTAVFIVEQIKVFLLMIIMHFALAPFFAAVSIYGRGFVPAFITLVSVIFINFVTVSSKYSALFPWTIPFVLSPNELEGLINPDYPVCIIILTINFVISIMYCVRNYQKADVNV